MSGLKVIAERPISSPHHFQVMGTKDGINGLSLFVTMIGRWGTPQRVMGQDGVSHVDPRKHGSNLAIANVFIGIQTYCNRIAQGVSSSEPSTYFFSKNALASFCPLRNP
jgi:hypothetical protein